MISKTTVKDILGELPLTAEVYWQLFQRGKPIAKNFSLHRVEKWLPTWCRQVEAVVHQKRARSHASGSHWAEKNVPRRIMVFSTLRYWLEHATLMSLAMAGLGHQVMFVYLPYANWNRPLHRFDLRRHNAYARKVFSSAAALLHPTSLLDVRPMAPSVDKLTAYSKVLPDSLMEAIREVSIRDTQYTLQIEEVDTDGGVDKYPECSSQSSTKSASARLYRLRLDRNSQAAAAALAWIQSLEPDSRPQVLLTPNGSILEMGAVYQVARYLGIPTVTYEFGEQRGRIWLAQDSEVMLQETEALWNARKDETLTGNQWKLVRDLYDSRQNAQLWDNFSRLWQGLPSQGGLQARQALGLDSRPVVLLAANVIGDSLTLGRQVFSKNMTEWLERSVQFFADRQDTQLVVRIHPGERYLKGPSVAQVVQNLLPEVPPHIHLVEAPDPINTYDLIQIADLGLAYTTTVGMEMAMSGVPVVVGGKTHYRGKGLTLDPTSWEGYYQLLDQILSDPEKYRLSREQVENAWRYAYYFFFDYPCPFPWHLLNFWNELETWSMERVLSEEGQAFFGGTFGYLAGKPRDWTVKTMEELDCQTID